LTYDPIQSTTYGHDPIRCATREHNLFHIQCNTYEHDPTKSNTYQHILLYSILADSHNKNNTKKQDGYGILCFNCK
jgi:hypothetical protein